MRFRTSHTAGNMYLADALFYLQLGGLRQRETACNESLA